ncbi:chorismate-binding protein [Micrococcales bacterium 31B]|nr:chorismate-binding protein [Micrococcales bacterium 31B]
MPRVTAANAPALAPLHLRAVTRRIVGDAAARVPSELARLLPDASALAWLRDGDGMVAWGEAARLDTPADQQFTAADTWWNDLASAAECHDEVRERGTGLIAFGSFAFSPHSPAGGVLIVPRVVFGRRDDTLWRTDILTPDDDAHRAGLPLADCVAALGPVRVPDLAAPPREPGLVEFEDEQPSSAHHTLVARVRDRIRAHGPEPVHKVVIARSVRATSPGGFDARYAVRRLSSSYPTTWTFSIDGMVGATPEMLLRQRGGTVHSRVLAGTQPQSGHPGDDARRREILRRSTKDLLEHEYAVRSVRDVLDRIGECHDAPDSPYILQLPNVAHLATEINASVEQGRYSSLALAGMLHPSAAICGTPTATAFDVIEAEEGMDRDRYSGPVGWLDAAGDGEWAIALRTARVASDGSSARLFAGGGIMAESDPQSEYLETIAKLQPMVRALGGN